MTREKFCARGGRGWGEKMNKEKAVPITTLEQALKIARSLRESIEREPRDQETLRIFAELAADYMEAFIAFLVWKARGLGLYPPVDEK